MGKFCSWNRTSPLKPDLLYLRTGFFIVSGVRGIIGLYTWLTTVRFTLLSVRGCLPVCVFMYTLWVSVYLLCALTLEARGECWTRGTRGLNN